MGSFRSSGVATVVADPDPVLAVLGGSSGVASVWFLLRRLKSITKMKTHIFMPVSS
jgi:hypothetical protein